MLHLIFIIICLKFLRGYWVVTFEPTYVHEVFLTTVLNIKETKFAPDMRSSKEAGFLSPPRKCEIFLFVFSILTLSQRNYYERGGQGL